MLGGGFLKQAQDSFTKNRELKNNALKGSLNRKDAGWKMGESLSSNDPKLNDVQRLELIAKVKSEAFRERLLIFVLILLILTVLFFMFFV